MLFYATLYYSKDQGSPSVPIRIMVGLLLLKQQENLSDEEVVLQWKSKPYYQAFCGMQHFQRTLPCHATELLHFRKRIGKDGIKQIFQITSAFALCTHATGGTAGYKCMGR